MTNAKKNKNARNLYDISVKSTRLKFIEAIAIFAGLGPMIFSSALLNATKNEHVVNKSSFWTYIISVIAIIFFIVFFPARLKMLKRPNKRVSNLKNNIINIYIDAIRKSKVNPSNIKITK